MKKSICSPLLVLAGICLALSVGLGAMLKPPVRSGFLPGTDTPVLTSLGDDAYTLVILADESVPMNRLSPLVQMARHSGGTTHILRQTDDLEPVRQFADRSESDILLFTYGRSWENALPLLEKSDRFASTVILSPAGSYEPERLSIRTPVMLLGTSSDQAPTSQRLAEIYNRLSGEKIAPNGLSYTSQSGNFRLRIVSASLDAYQTFSDDTLRAISDWYDDSAGIRMGGPGSSSLLRPASWVLGIGGLLLLLTALYRLLSEELLDVGYSLLPLEVTAPARYSLFKALSWLPALVLLVLPALALLLLPLPGLTSIPALFCGYFGCLGLVSLLLIRLRKMPGVTGSLAFSPIKPSLQRSLIGLGALTAVLLLVLMLHQSGLYTLHFSAGKLPVFLLCGIAAALGTAGWLYDAMLLDQCKHRLPMRLCLEILPFLPYAALGFLSIPAYGFTGFYTVILLAGALIVDLLLAQLLRLILGTVWVPAAVSGVLMGIFAAFAAL